MINVTALKKVFNKDKGLRKFWTYNEETGEHVIGTTHFMFILSDNYLNASPKLKALLVGEGLTENSSILAGVVGTPPNVEQLVRDIRKPSGDILVEVPLKVPADRDNPELDVFWASDRYVLVNSLYTNVFEAGGRYQSGKNQPIIVGNYGIIMPYRVSGEHEALKWLDPEGRYNG